MRRQTTPKKKTKKAKKLGKLSKSEKQLLSLGNTSSKTTDFVETTNSKKSVKQTRPKTDQEDFFTGDLETVVPEDEYPLNDGPGRPPVYNPKTHPKRAYELTLIGLKDKELAVAFGVQVSTIDRWKREHAEFRKSVRRGKLPTDAKVLKSTLKNALGYDYKEKHTTTRLSKKGKLIVEVKEVTKHQPGNVVAQKFWTTNRLRAIGINWGERVQAEHTGKDGGPIEVKKEIPLDDLSSEELQMALRLKMAVAGKSDE